MIIVLFDGGCSLCSKSIILLKRLDRKRKFSFIPYQNIQEHSLLAELHAEGRLEDCVNALHVVHSQREILKGWDAVALLLRQYRITWLAGFLGAMWPLRVLLRKIYRGIARKRHGKACAVDSGFSENTREIDGR